MEDVVSHHHDIYSKKTIHERATVRKEIQANGTTIDLEERKK